MAGTPWNKLTPEEHRRRGSFRFDRHGPKVQAPVSRLTTQEREGVTEGLHGEPLRIAAGTLAHVGDTFPADPAQREYLVCFLRVQALELADRPPQAALLREYRRLARLRSAMGE